MKDLILKKLEQYSVRLNNSGLKPLRPLLNAVEGFFFRSAEVSTAAPHLRDANNLKRMFIFVVLAAFPSAIAGIYFFGWRGLLLILTSYIVGVGLETVFAIVRKEEISEGAFVTCMLYPLILPPDLPLWMVALGIFVGILFGKEVFGGTGYNIFNPALVGRVFLYISFPAAMTGNWVIPMDGIGGFFSYSGDALTAATPLAAFKTSGELSPLWSLFWGNVSGSLGETSAILIIMGGLFLVITRIADWRIPLSFLLGAAISAFILNTVYPARSGPPVFQILSGGMLFGAFFMATDPVSSPFTRGGRWIFGALCGLLTVLIRGFSGYAEGVMFAILFMNIFSSMIDEMILRYRYRSYREMRQ